MPKVAHKKHPSSPKKPYKRPSSPKRKKGIPLYETLDYTQKEARILAALAAIEDPDDVDTDSFRVASIIFDVPAKTLWNRAHGINPLANNGGHNCRIDEAQESTLIWYCDTAIERGFPLNYSMVVAAATKILSASGTDMTLEANRLGKHWARRWIVKQNKLNRYHGVTTKPMEQKRRDGVTAEMIKDYFQKLEACKKKYDIQPSDTYNVDETGFQVGCITSTVVITHKNIRQVSCLASLIPQYSQVIGVHQRSPQ